MYYQALKSELAELRLAIREQTDHINAMDAQGDVPHSIIQSAENHLEDLVNDHSNLSHQLSGMEY